MDIRNTKILYAVLNWGLGHASRSIPVIRQLLVNNNTITIASSGDSLKLLKVEFPYFTFFEIPDYKVEYRFKNVFFNAAFQFFKIRNTIKKERQTIENIVKISDIHLIISDSAYGAYHRNIKSVLISHQIRLPLPGKMEYIRKWVDNYYTKFLKPFDEIWIPDFEDQPNLSGNLAHDFSSKLNIKYIGPQSRFQIRKTIEQKQVRFKIIAILSGPEPARTEFEKQILKIFKDIEGKKAIVRGKFDSELIHESDAIEVFNHLNSSELELLIDKSGLIICRSGYSSLMDLTILNKRAIIVPTPGQTEQEYLAGYHSDSSLFYSCSQKNLKSEFVKSVLSNESL